MSDVTNLRYAICNANFVQYIFLTIIKFQHEIKNFKCTSEKRESERGEKKEQVTKIERISTVKQNAF